MGRRFSLTLHVGFAEVCMMLVRRSTIFEFHMTQLVFLGLVLTKDKVRAIVDAREPQDALELRSFLGLANYNARLIPDFATVAEPLRTLLD